eukprot:gnl/Chilomastix_cuspidata/5161.p1 GENE.gnl/Chilomastix_cuspidata/5161~~gnl/Chilomastix_cuspidata/5161.p1  ORF type:complete len:577 (+),score=231.05 gnl/Chilomastix_cuspidata/5161:101-1831(+)
MSREESTNTAAPAVCDADASAASASSSDSPQFTKKELKKLKKQHKHIEFSKGYIHNLLIRLALPTIVSFEATGIYGIVDTIFIGNGVGSLGLAGVALFQPIESIISYLFATIPCNGASIVIAEALGKGEIARAEALLTQCLGMCFLIGAALAAALIPNMMPLLRWLGASEELAEATYLSGIILSASGFIMSLNNGLGPLLRIEHKARLAMLRLLAFSALNTLIDPIMIYGFGLGLEGASISTVLSASIVGFSLLVWYLNPRSSATCHMRLRYLLPRNVNWADFRKMFVLSIPSFMSGMSVHATLIIINLQIYKFTADETTANAHVAAIGAGNRIFMALLSVTYGFVYGMIPLLGYNIAQRRFLRAYNTLVTSLFWSMLTAVVLEVLVEALAGPISRVFGDDAAFMACAARDIRMVNLGYVFEVALVFMWMSAMSEQSAGLGILCSVLRPVLFVPALYALPLAFTDPVVGILASFPLSDVAAAAIACALLVPFLRRYRRLAADADAAPPYTLRALLTGRELRRTREMKEQIERDVVAWELRTAKATSAETTEPVASVAPVAPVDPVEPAACAAMEEP